MLFPPCIGGGGRGGVRGPAAAGRLCLVQLCDGVRERPCWYRAAGAAAAAATEHGCCPATAGTATRATDPRARLRGSDDSLALIVEAALYIGGDRDPRWGITAHLCPPLFIQRYLAARLGHTPCHREYLCPLAGCQQTAHGFAHRPPLAIVAEKSKGRAQGNNKRETA